MRTLLLICYLLSADQSDYDGKDLTFTGKFQVDHPMGTIKAEKATLKDLQTKRSPLLLEEGVCIEAARTKTPFTLTARRGSAELPSHLLFSLLQMQEIQFFEDIVITTSQNVKATGGYARYKTGALILYPALPVAHCHLYRNLDHLSSTEIRFDLFNGSLFSANPEGTFSHSPKSPPLHFSAQTLFWQKKEGRIRLEGQVAIDQPEQCTVYSDSALLTLEKGAIPKTCFFEGNIRMISPRIQDKPSCALADSMTLCLADQTLVLSAKSPKRVLFWQDGFSLSAPEIHIRKDPLSGKESIEGKGDVHFAFDSQEKNVIEQLLSKYL